MAQARSLTSAYDIVDYTEELNLIPNTYGLVNELGIFSEQNVSQNVVQLESYSGTIGLVADQYRGFRNQVNKDDGRKAYAFSLTHHPLDDLLTARELVGVRAYGNANAAETEAAALARKLERIARSHNQTLEVARVHTLVTGTQFSPNGTVSENFFTTFGITQKVINFALAGSGATLVRDKSREAIDHIQENILSGEMPTGHIALCSPQFFDALVSQAGVTTAWLATATMAQYNQNGFRSGSYDQITFGGIRYIRYLGFRPTGEQMIPSGEAYIIPVGTMDTFVSMFGPAERFDTINTLGERQYVWTQRSEDNTSIKFASESNFLNLVRRPSCIVKATAA